MFSFISYLLDLIKVIKASSCFSDVIFFNSQIILSNTCINKENNPFGP